jgi:hypothetical protein
MSAQDLIVRINAAAQVAPEQLPKGAQPRDHMIAFEYTDAHGTRGCMRILNTRARLLAFAEQVRKNAAAFDGKPRSKPAGPRKIAGASPLSTARALLKDGARVEALAALEARGGEVFFGAAGVPVLHQVAQRVEHEGRRWVVTRCAVDGLIYLIHEASGLSAGGKGLPEMRSIADALARLELVHRDEAENGYRQRMIAAIEQAADYDQQAARAAFEACDGLKSKDAAPVAQEAYQQARALSAAQVAPDVEPAVDADPSPVESEAEAAPPVAETPAAADTPAAEIESSAPAVAPASPPADSQAGAAPPAMESAQPAPLATAPGRSDALIARAIAWVAVVWGTASVPSVADYRAGRCDDTFPWAGGSRAAGYLTWADLIGECMAALERDDSADQAARDAALQPPTPIRRKGPRQHEQHTPSRATRSANRPRVVDPRAARLARRGAARRPGDRRAARITGCGARNGPRAAGGARCPPAGRLTPSRGITAPQACRPWRDASETRDCTHKNLEHSMTYTEAIQALRDAIAQAPKGEKLQAFQAKREKIIGAMPKVEICGGEQCIRYPKGYRFDCGREVHTDWMWQPFASEEIAMRPGNLPYILRMPAA